MITWGLSNNDVYLDANGNVAVLRSEINVLRQEITTQIQTFLSEVFTDTRIGLDFFGIMINEQLPLGEKQKALSDIITAIDGVIRIESIQFYTDKRTRTASYDINIDTEFGQIKLEDIGVEY